MPAGGRDPSGYVTSPPSVVVRVVGTARDDINGLLGIVISYNLERERYLVHMTYSQSTMALKKENLAKANMMESYRAQWQQLQNDPRVREKMARYVTLCQQHVAPLQLSHVLIGIITVIMVLLYLVGLAKTIMTTSVLVLIVVITAQDLVNKVPLHVIIKNFPSRARLTMEQQLPVLKGKLTNRMAVGMMMFLVALCLKSLLLGGGRRLLGHSGPILDRSSMEEYYNLGFEDATKGRRQGFSLEEEIIALEPNNVQTLGPDEDQNDKQTLLYKLCNLTNLASVFYLYRSVIDLGTDQSTNLFSVGQLAANMQHHTEWWRKALLLLSLYNFLRIFL